MQPIRLASYANVFLSKKLCFFDFPELVVIFAGRNMGHIKEQWDADMARKSEVCYRTCACNSWWTSLCWSSGRLDCKGVDEKTGTFVSCVLVLMKRFFNIYGVLFFAYVLLSDSYSGVLCAWAHLVRIWKIINVIWDGWS